MGGFPGQPQMPQMGGMPQQPQMPGKGAIAGQVAGGVMGGMMGGALGGIGGMFGKKKGAQAGAGGAASAEEVEEGWTDHIKIFCFVFAGLGLAWFGSQLLLSVNDNPVENFKAILHFPMALKLFFFAVPIMGILCGLVGWLPMNNTIRAGAQLATGLVLTALLLAQPGGEGGAQGMLGGGWVRYAMLIGFFAAGAGLWVRGHSGEEDNMVAKIMAAGGGALLASAFLVPVHGKIPLVIMMQYIGKVPTEMKIVFLMSILLFLLAAAAIASFFVPALAKLGKIHSYAITFWWAATVAFVTALDVFSDRWVGSYKARFQKIIELSAPSTLCIGGAVFGIAYFVHKFLGAHNQQQA